jgi:hypothetical protein
LIICIELVNAAIGTALGASAWDHFSRPQASSGGFLQVNIILLICLVFFIRYFTQTFVKSRRHKRLYIYALFCLNFIAYILVGGIGAERVSTFHPSGGLGSKEVRSVYMYDWTKPAPAVAPSQERAPVPASARRGSSLGGTRVGYFFLFILGLILAYGAAAIACNLACSGYGVGAVMVLLLGTGILAAGIYFLGRALDRNLKLYRDMTREERKREGRRYRRTWLGVAIGLGLLFLLSALSSQ